MWVKICGTTNLEDALLALAAGADALGFVFAKSPRQMSVEQVGQIVRELPKQVEKIGVFVNAGAEEIARGVNEAGLSGVQLHGDEGVGLVEQVSRMGVKVIKAVRAAQVAAMADTAGALAGEGAAAVVVPQGLDALLIDSGSAGRRGGTGASFAWMESRDFVRWMGRSVRIIVAGGLTSTNVGEAIRILEPWGVDVVSGVESAPGKKDPAKIKEFIRAAKSSITGERRA